MKPLGLRSQLQVLKVLLESTIHSQLKLVESCRPASEDNIIVDGELELLHFQRGLGR